MGIGIWGDVPKIPQVNGADKVGKAYGAKTTKNIQEKKDDITISENAKDYNMVMRALKDVPDIREDKVNELRDKYESGKYDVSESDVADKLLESLKRIDL